MNSYDFALIQYNNALTRIELLESQLKEKDALLREAVTIIKSYYVSNSADTLKYMDDITEEFLTKPEVKKIMDNKGE